MRKNYSVTSINSPPLIIVAPPKFQKKASTTSNNCRPLIFVALYSDLVINGGHYKTVPANRNEETLILSYSW